MLRPPPHQTPGPSTPRRRPLPARRAHRRQTWFRRHRPRPPWRSAGRCRAAGRLLLPRWHAPVVATDGHRVHDRGDRVPVPGDGFGGAADPGGSGTGSSGVGAGAHRRARRPLESLRRGFGVVTAGREPGTRRAGVIRHAHPRRHDGSCASRNGGTIRPDDAPPTSRGRLRHQHRPAGNRVRTNAEVGHGGPTRSRGRVAPCANGPSPRDGVASDGPRAGPGWHRKGTGGGPRRCRTAPEGHAGRPRIDRRRPRCGRYG